MMVPFEKQVVTVVRERNIGTDVSYEPPLRIGFGINDKTVDTPNATMGRSILVPGAGPNPTHYHAANDVVWYILYGKIKLWYARSDASDRQEVILEGGDFVYVPAGAIHVIANASETEEASLVFCYIGVPNTDAAETVWLSEDGRTRLQPEPVPA
ncbi:MAG: cupin domain-containing protein [Chelatococcus sp.]|nr:cupin domain-containing protein [Chelatococcus sp.]